MTTSVFPQDSTLRRHFDSAVEFRRLAQLQELPSDSTLRRHAEQLRQAAAAPAAAPAAAARPSPAPTSASSARPAAPPLSPAPATPAPTPRKSGLMGWLSRLFGG